MLSECSWVVMMETCGAGRLSSAAAANIPNGRCDDAKLREICKLEVMFYYLRDTLLLL